MAVPVSVHRWTTLVVLQLLLTSTDTAHSFAPSVVATVRLYTPRYGAGSAETDERAPPPAAAVMRVTDIRDELNRRGVVFTDCFDKESLVQRLNEARDGTTLVPDPSHENDNPHTDTATHQSTTAVTIDPTAATASEPATNINNTTTTTTNATVPLPPVATGSTPVIPQRNREETLTELRSMRVRQLREELAHRGLRWAGLLEKEDLVRAVWNARETAATFSSTGLITPGKVAALTGPQITEEIALASSPLLLDVYATWCGPCQMMTPQLEAAAHELGSRVRVAKMDSDQYPQEASKLRVQGLPTLALFRDGEEIDRVEGALLKDQLLQWVQSHGI